MKKNILFAFAFIFSLNLHAWWDAGHLVTAMIAYENLNAKAKAKVDELFPFMQRDYDYVNNFTALATWPDDIKAEGVRSYNTWHYTNLPYNPKNIALPTPPKVNIVWAIDQALSVLRASKVKQIDKARHLAFLVHFVGDIHQPLHSTTMYSNELPGGNIGGNAFPIASFGRWKNLHAAWDDGCGYLSEYKNIRPYGESKKPISDENMKRLKKLAKKIMKAHPRKKLMGVENLDRDFWALEGHKLAIKYGYKGVQKVDEKGRNQYIQPNDPLSDYYLAQGQEVVEKQLAMGGYRLAALLNEALGQ